MNVRITPKDCPGPELCAPVAEQKWHLKKEIHLGHIITTLTVAVSAVVYIQKIEQRLALLEKDTQYQHQRDDSQDKALNDSSAETRKRFDRIDEKLDRLLSQIPSVPRANR